jgi:hypothetical protein
MDRRQIESFDITIPRAFAYRLLGIRAGDRAPRASATALIDEAFAEAAALVEARAVMHFSHAGLPGSAHVPPDVPLVAVVCTIGPALEARVAEYAASGESARAAVLDAVGSAAAEEVADASNRLVCQLAVPTDLRPAARRSPGYGTWDIAEQRVLFAFTQPGDIGVSLTEHCMMVPRKSVSYVVRLDADAATEVAADRCARCADPTCPYRETSPGRGRPGAHTGTGGGDGRSGVGTGSGGWGGRDAPAGSEAGTGSETGGDRA